MSSVKNNWRGRGMFIFWVYDRSPSIIIKKIDAVFSSSMWLLDKVPQKLTSERLIILLEGMHRMCCCFPVPAVNVVPVLSFHCCCYGACHQQWCHGSFHWDLSSSAWPWKYWNNIFCNAFNSKHKQELYLFFVSLLHHCSIADQCSPGKKRVRHSPSASLGLGGTDFPNQHCQVFEVPSWLWLC